MKLLVHGLNDEKYWHNYCVYSVINMFDSEHIYDKTIDQLFDDVCDDKYNDYVIFFHMFYGFSHIFKNMDKWEMLKIDKNIKTILYFNDTHTDTYINDKSLNFFDKLLFPSLAFSNLFFNSFHHKIHLFPFSFDNNIRFDIKNEHRNKKCILYGSIHESIYPLRYHIFHHKNHHIDKFKHFGSVRRKNHNVVGKKMIQHLSKYSAAIGTSAEYPLNYLLSKYVEILGAGCLAFFEYCPELDKIGLKPYVHYVPINSLCKSYYTKKGYKSKIFNHSLFDSKIDKYLNTSLGENIRIAGHHFIMNNVTMKQRHKQFFEIINSMSNPNPHHC